VREELVLTIIGLDRPGLVELLSSVVASHDGNWEASRMARMAGRFAGILRVVAPSERIDELGRALGALEGRGLRVVVERSAPAAPPAVSRLLRLELVGNDRPGVVRDLSAVLVAHGINVEELATDTGSAPMAGGMILKVVAQLRAPETVALAALRQEIEARTPDFMVELAPFEPER
jgi:glycine cleavage system regulatory protein